LTGGLRQYMWCPRSQASHSSMCSPSVLRRQMRQYACSDDRDHAMLDSSTEQWTHSCERLVESISDSSQRSNGVLCFFTTSTLAMLPSKLHTAEQHWNEASKCLKMCTDLHGKPNAQLEHHLPYKITQC